MLEFVDDVIDVAASRTTLRQAAALLPVAECLAHNCARVRELLAGTSVFPSPGSPDPTPEFIVDYLPQTAPNELKDLCLCRSHLLARFHEQYDVDVFEVLTRATPNGVLAGPTIGGSAVEVVLIVADADSLARPTPADLASNIFAVFSPPLLELLRRSPFSEKESRGIEFDAGGFAALDQALVFERRWLHNRIAAAESKYRPEPSPSSPPNTAYTAVPHACGRVQPSPGTPANGGMDT